MKGENMNKKIDIKSLLLGFLLGGVIVFSVAAATRTGPIMVSEYHWITPDRRTFETDLNQAGKDGWELVTAVPDSNKNNMSAVLKRSRPRDR